jgi:hypothetical protein
VIDTGAVPPGDVAEPGAGVPEPGPTVRVRDRSVVVLTSHPE